MIFSIRHVTTVIRSFLIGRYWSVTLPRHSQGKRNPRSILLNAGPILGDAKLNIAMFQACLIAFFLSLYLFNQTII